MVLAFKTALVKVQSSIFRKRVSCRSFSQTRKRGRKVEKDDTRSKGQDGARICLHSCLHSPALLLALRSPASFRFLPRNLSARTLFTRQATAKRRSTFTLTVFSISREADRTPRLRDSREDFLKSLCSLRIFKIPRYEYRSGKKIKDKWQIYYHYMYYYQLS